MLGRLLLDISRPWDLRPPGQGLDRLAGLPLVCARLKGNELTDNNRAALRGMPIHSLTLAGIGVSDSKLSEVVLDLPNLRHLFLTECPVTDTGLAALEGLPRLEKLSLLDCRNIDGSGLGVLVGAPLTDLSLSGCTGVNDAGLGALVGLLLSRLNLEGCRLITNNGIRAIRDLPLARLSLRGCLEITEGGLRALVGMPLAVLHIDQCPRLTGEVEVNFWRARATYEREMRLKCETELESLRQGAGE